MSLEERTGPYKALATINLPFLDDGLRRPGDEVTVEDLIAAKQTDEDIEKLIADGALGEADDDLHPSTIIPDPAMPTIQSVVSQAKDMVAHLEENNEEVPAEIRAVADLEIRHVTTSEVGGADESN